MPGGQVRSGAVKELGHSAESDQEGHPVLKKLIPQFNQQALDSLSKKLQVSPTATGHSLCLRCHPTENRHTRVATPISASCLRDICPLSPSKMSSASSPVIRSAYALRNSCLYHDMLADCCERILCMQWRQSCMQACNQGIYVSAVLYSQVMFRQ